MKNYVKQNWLLSVCMIMVSINLMAQNHFDIVSISYNKYSPDYKSGSGNLEEEILKGSATAATNTVGKDKLFVGWESEFRKFENNTNNPIGELYSNVLNVGYLKNYNNDKQKLLFILIQKLNGNYSSLKKHYQIGGFAKYTYRFNKKISELVGGYVNTEFDEILYFPMVGIDWKMSEKSHLYLLLPNEFRYEYKLIKDKLYAGTDANWNISSYRISNNEQIDICKD